MPEVRLIDSEGNQVGVVPRDDALKLAKDSDLDLVEISPNAKPPVCKIMDHGKYLYEQSKRDQAARKKQTVIQVKEVKFRPNTEDGDFQVKLRNLRKFLEQGNKVKVSLRFRGREMAHQELGMRMMDRVREAVVEEAIVEQHPKREGRQLVMMLSAKKVSK